MTFKTKQNVFFQMSILLCGRLIGGCDDAALVQSSFENTEALCQDGADNDGDGTTDCDDAECRAFAHCIPQDVPADISGMPIPPAEDVSQPSGDASNLIVLDWAGFKAAVSYTFDDTHVSHVEHYDALQNTGVRMTFFAVSETATDIEAWRRAVADGHEIGNHTAHHCHGGLDTCAFGTALDSAEAEIETCTNHITENFKQDGVWTMASPYGEPWWGMYAKDYFFLNRSVNTGTIAPNDAGDPFNLPSFMLSGTASTAELKGDIDAVYEAGEWLIFCVHALLPTQDADWGIPIEVITESIAYGKEAGDLWIDSMVNVGAYWRGQKVLTETAPETNGDTTIWTWTLPDHFPPGKYLRVAVDGGTLSQSGRPIAWSPHGYYEIALDAGELTLSP